MKKLDELLAGKSTVAIAGHIRPDGDCTGSCLGVYNYICRNYPDITADVYLEQIPESFLFLQGADKIKHDMQEDKTYDLFIALDSGDLGRLGDAVPYFEAAGHTVCIDHHISNIGYADENYIVADASSTCELVYLMLEDEKIDKASAAALYVGIVHDTGIFQYSSTGEQTMQIAGRLMSKGIPFTEIIDQTYYEKSYAQKQILGRGLLESMLLLDGQCIFTAIKKSTMDFYNVEPKDLDGIVSHLRSTKGVECAIFLYETASHEYKVSMRSKEKVDVSKIAALFGGGGHVRAAGCTMSGTMHDTVNNIVVQVERQLSAHNAKASSYADR